MVFGSRQKLIFIVVSLVIIVISMSYSIYNEIKVTKAYLVESFDKFSSELEIVAEDTKLKALEVQKTMEDPTNIYTDEVSARVLKINTYPGRGVDEYGFNQGVYPDEVALGSLYGRGTLPDDFNKSTFLVFDRIWSGYQASLIPTLPFALSYQYQYVYLGGLTKFGTKDKPVFPGSLTPERYRDKIMDTYQSSIDKYGYFFSKPFTTFIGNRWRIFVIVPLYREETLIGDLGSSILIDDLIELLNIYPRLDKGIDIKLHYLSGIELKLSDSSYHTLPSYQFSYQLPGDLSFSVTYDLYYFVQEKVQFFLMLCVFFVVIYSYLSFVDKQKRHQQKLRDQLNIDPMTQIYNRRVIDNEIIAKVRQVKLDENLAVSIIAIDADKFKKINDTHGHNIGDKAILHIAKTMQKFIREGDYCIRMGGDEFMLVLFNVDEQQAEQIGQRLCKKVLETSKSEVGVEFSVTCATIQLQPDEVFDQAYKRVDDGLYTNKRAD